MFNAGSVDYRLFDDMFERNGFSPPERHIGSDDNLCLRAIDPAVKGCRTETAENNAMDCTDACTGKHGDNLLGDHRHIDTYPVPFGDPEFL